MGNLLLWRLKFQDKEEPLDFGNFGQELEGRGVFQTNLTHSAKKTTSLLTIINSLGNNFTLVKCISSTATAVSTSRLLYYGKQKPCQSARTLQMKFMINSQVVPLLLLI